MISFGLFITLFGLISGESSRSRIIGGSNAPAGQYPFACAINVTTSSTKFFCGGTLLGDQWIVTAAQCVNGATSFAVQLGTTRLNSEDPSKVTVATTEYFIHPNFNSVTLDSDIGVIKLREPLHYSTYVRSVFNLPTSEFGDGVTYHFVGWGQTSDNNGALAEVLQSVRLISLSNIECRLTYGNAVTDNMLCAAGNYNEGTCIGDTGSPLLSMTQFGIGVPYGIASFVSANGCESPDPSGFTRIYPFVDWIVNITGFTLY